MPLLLVATSPCAKFDPRSTRNKKMADVKPEVLVPEIAYGIYVKFQRIPHICLVRRMLVLSDIRVSEKSKLAA